MSNPDEIMQLFSQEVYLNIATQCLDEPQSVTQIASAISHKTVNVGVWVKQLEAQGIIRFTSVGWKTSDEAAVIIRKYFM